jgi:hypothetical protein
MPWSKRGEEVKREAEWVECGTYSCELAVGFDAVRLSGCIAHGDASEGFLKRLPYTLL